MSIARLAWEKAAGPVFLVGVFAALASWSYRRWTDPLIDFGAELYIPWRLVEGDRLYADLAYRNGPLSPYLNALWFRLFGVALSSLVAPNLALLAVLCALGWSLLRAADRLGRTVAILALLILFGFGQLTDVANYNWVTPYQHSQTHGVLLGFATIAALSAALRSGRPASWAVAGTGVGLVFLTKAELVVPAVVAAATAWVLELAGRPAGRGTRLRRLGSFAAGACTPPALAFALLATEMPPGRAARGLLGNWPYIGEALLADRFYREGSGLDAPVANATAALGAFALLGLASGLTLALDRSWARRPSSRALAVSIGIATFLGLAVLGERIPWLEVARALPLTSLGAVGLLGASWWRHRDDAAAREPIAALLMLASYALALLGKMLLAARFEHYGFALAMPATLLLVVGAASGLPRVAERWGGGRMARALGVALVSAALLGLWSESRDLYAQRTHWVGPDPDAIRVPPEQGLGLERMLAEIDALPPGATLLALPEGLMLNYWTRRRNPSRHWLFLPAEIEAAGGEAVVLEDLRAHPPDFVALVDRPHHEFGVGRFGIDRRNGRRIGDFVRANYRRVAQVGRPRVTLLVRRGPP